MLASDDRDGPVAPDCCDIAFVDVPKRLRGPAEASADDVACSATTRLHRRGRDTRHWFAAGSHDGEVTDHKYLRTTGHAQIGLDDHASQPIGWRADLLTEKRRRVASRPEDGPCRHSFGPDREDIASDLGYLGIHANLDAEVLQLLCRFHRDVFREGR